jgi:hypothetical protein
MPLKFRYEKRRKQIGGEDIQFRPLVQVHHPRSMKLSEHNHILNRSLATVDRPKLNAPTVALTDDDAAIDVWLRLGHGVWLPGWLGRSWEVGGLLSRPDAEDRGLPLVALLRQLLVLGGLGGDAARERDVLKDRVILGHGHVDLLILNLSLGLLLLILGLLRLLLVSGEDAAVEVWNLILGWARLGFLLGTIGLLLDAEEEGIELGDVVADLLLDNLLDDRTHDLEE